MVTLNDIINQKRQEYPTTDSGNTHPQGSTIPFTNPDQGQYVYDPVTGKWHWVPTNTVPGGWGGTHTEPKVPASPWQTTPATPGPIGNTPASTGAYFDPTIQYWVFPDGTRVKRSGKPAWEQYVAQYSQTPNSTSSNKISVVPWWQDKYGTTNGEWKSTDQKILDMPFMQYLMGKKKLGTWTGPNIPMPSAQAWSKLGTQEQLALQGAVTGAGMTWDDWSKKMGAVNPTWSMPSTTQYAVR